MNSDKIVDCKGLFCPMPVVGLNKAIKEIEMGQILEVLATDPASVPDFRAWTMRTGNELLESKEEKGVYKFFIRKTK
ncbi:MAG: sulfurtransferase TusA family protein [Nitrospirota bacterium]